MSESIDHQVPVEGADTTAPSPDTSEGVGGGSSEPAGAAAEAAPVEAADKAKADLGAKADAKVEATAEAAASGTPGFVQMLRDSVLDDSKSGLDDFVKNIKQRDIDALDPKAKLLIANVMRFQDAEKQVRLADLTRKEAAVRGRAGEVERQAEALHAQRAGLLKLLNRPEMQEALKADDSKLDLMTEAGQKAAIAKGIAEQFQKAITPLEQQTTAEAKRLAYRAWAKDKPELRNKAFLADMKARMESRKTVGVDLLTEDAYSLVKQEWATKTAEKKQAKSRALRAQASRSLGTGAGTGQASKRPPKGAKASEIAAWIKANPGHRA